MVISPLLVIYFARIFSLLLSYLWQLWCYGISKCLCCKIFLSIYLSSFLVVREKMELRGLKCYILDPSWVCVCSLTLNKTHNSTKLPFCQLGHSTVCPAFPHPGCHEGHGRSRLRGFTAILSFTVKLIHSQTLRASLLASALSGSVIFKESVPCP